MKWKEFRGAAEELAEAAEKLFEKSGVLLLGTVRKDGSPRISPVEPFIVEGELYLGIMWRTLKALDLLRDPRCTVHNLIRDRHATEGEFKLHGRARDVQDEVTRDRFCDAVKKKLGWSPKGMKYHLFAIEVESAALFTADGNARLVKRWRAGQSVEEYRQTM
ncbi:MAG: pyridoxamine 5'-phosphate oxidase family protein [Acidobacteria bacterium]|nr:pyridoxamine 5'-phosphate oxidase family protein [Acidobacteriota bacterium]